MTPLQTNRLTLRMFRPSDFEAYAEMLADPEVTRYLGNGRPLSRTDAWRHLALVIGHWQLRGYGLWAVEERETGVLVGRIGCWNPEGWPGIEVGWALRRAYWGRGYATEGARAALQYAFSEMNLSHVISLIRPDNKASIRVAERLGERLEARTEIMGQEVLIYGIDGEDWQGKSEQEA